MYQEAVARQARGYGAGIWHPVHHEGGSQQRYARGLCPVTERMHFDELMTTTICRADLTQADAMELVHAVHKIVEHKRAIRDALGSRGIA
jgi:hypothetical protein